MCILIRTLQLFYSQKTKCKLNINNQN